MVESSLDEPDLTGAGLAAIAGFSRFHFDRLVAAAVGEPPGALRRRLLLERSAYRLATTTAKVLDVAVEAGFESGEAFARAFSGAFGRSPSAYRRSGTTHYLLASASDVHFQPPGGLRLPAALRSTSMDLLTAMYDHHIDTSRAIIDRLDAVDPDVLDRRIELSVEGIDPEPTLRSVAARLVGQLEMWATAIAGDQRPPTHDTEPDQLRARLDRAAPRFEHLVVAQVRDGNADTTFIDTSCSPVQTFTLGGVLAHVLTFAAVRRTMAIGALDAAGIDDLGSGDPMGSVGGTGDDAATITRGRGHA